jgi:hypothetical protein
MTLPGIYILDEPRPDENFGLDLTERGIIGLRALRFMILVTCREKLRVIDGTTIKHD